VKPETAQFLAYARQMLVRGQAMIEGGLNEDGGRAAYLASFHAAQAYIFEREGRAAKSHRGVQSSFYRLTKDRPTFDAELRAFLARSYDLKTTADYESDPNSTTSASEARAAIETAARFVNQVEKLIDGQPI
jgi:uncharacterized protein (UPF0332 family)